jgi:hypothetical protein
MRGAQYRRPRPSYETTGSGGCTLLAHGADRPSQRDTTYHVAHHFGPSAFAAPATDRETEARSTGTKEPAGPWSGGRSNVRPAFSRALPAVA